jgi:threonine aldolase
MAQRLASLLDVEVLYPVQANAVFARAESPAGHAWEAGVCRFMCSWDTTPEDVDAFAREVR